MLSQQEARQPQVAKAGDSERFGLAERDVIALGISIACIIMFVGIGAPVLADVVRSFQGVGLGPDKLAINALLLNIALVIFSWRRYRQLQDEVAERRKAEQQARELAEVDPLTGCLNRRSIGPATDRLIADAAARGEIIAFLMVDLDNFKQVNDYHGHSAGDAILQECARRISLLLPPHGLIARLGGDEFACVLPFAPGRDDIVDRLAGGIIDAVSRPVAINGLNVEATVSIGITRSDTRRAGDTGPVDAQILMHMADIAMYHAKKHGRNRYFWFEAPMESELRFRSELEAGIRRGIAAGEFVPFYEQQIDLATGRLTGFEMLARWHSPSLGTISPEIFIPVAEDIGVIAELSESLIRQALEDAKCWSPELTLSVNISPVQLRDPWFAQRLLKILVEANFPPSRLEIEITESCLHENVGIVRSLLTSLKNQGIRVSLDDFGTGYSSLSQLRTLPFDQIKIDRSFIMSMQDSTDSETIVRAIAALGNGLNLPITAEGIESDAVLEKLRQFGRIKGQGYLYGRPEGAAPTRERLAGMNLLAERQTSPGAEPQEQPAPGRKRRSA
jgi:diguanylate cyclase (GGDEF)-like protein